MTLGFQPFVGSRDQVLPRNHPPGTVCHDFFLKTFQDQLRLSDAMQVLDGAVLTQHWRISCLVQQMPKKSFAIGGIQNICENAIELSSEIHLPNGRNPNSACFFSSSKKNAQSKSRLRVKHRYIKLTCYDTHTSTQPIKSSNR